MATAAPAAFWCCVITFSFESAITFGANNLYKTGVTILVSKVELMRPPIITKAKENTKDFFQAAAASRRLR